MSAPPTPATADDSRPRTSSLWQEAAGAGGPRRRKRALRLLRAAPWLWPADGAAPHGHPVIDEPRPSLAPGQVLLVALSDDGRIADLCALGGSPSDAASVLSFAPSASAALETATIAMRRTAPLRLYPVEHSGATSPHRLISVPTSPSAQTRSDGAAAPLRHSLAGASFGLAFYLHAASLAARTPLRADVAALATVDARGQLGAVDGLPAKLTALARVGLAVQTVLVAPAQVQLATETLAGLGVATTVVGKRAAAEVLDVAFAASPATVIAAARPEVRRRLVANLFQLTLDGHNAVSHWRGVASAATAALHAWRSDLPEDQTLKLGFSAAVAHRHAGSPDHALPPYSWTASLPGQLRRQLLAHYIQDSTDRGAVLAPAAEAEARAVAEPDVDLGAADCRVLGAWGRYRAITGAPREAMALQARAARQWLALSQPEQASRPLCEWMRLAGALGDADAAVAARAFARELHAIADLSGADLRYLRLWRAVMALRAPTPPEERAAALNTLAQVIDDPRCPPHVAYSAARWSLVRGEPDQVSAARAMLTAGADHTATLRALFLALSEPPAEAAAASEPALAAMGAVVPGVAAHLARTYAGPGLGAALRRWFNY